MKLKYKMEIVDIDGSLMAVPVDSGDKFRGVLHMNSTAQDILETLKNDVTEDEIVNVIQNAYGAPEQEIRKDVRSILEILREHQLLAE